MKQVMIVTGSGRGIGAATAKLASERGYAVCVNYLHNRSAADAVIEEIVSTGGEAIAIAADVSQEADIVHLFETVEQQLGPIKVLVNNAGVLDKAARVDEMTAERIDRILAANVRGPMLCAREAVKRMSTRYAGRGGVIVNVSSVTACLGSPGEFVDYAASKGAIDTFTIGLAKEVADEGIRVNAVRPGIVLTDMHASGGQPDKPQLAAPMIPMKRPGRPEEIAFAILWLASDEASYATGTILNVGGGR